MKIQELYRKQGYAPGDYFNKCSKCGQPHFCDKRALTCFECASEEIDKITDIINKMEKTL